VHDARAVMGEPLDEAAGCLRLVGTAVEASDGRFLGRVRPPPFLLFISFFLPPRRLRVATQFCARPCRGAHWGVVSAQPCGAATRARPASPAPARGGACWCGPPLCGERVAQGGW